MLSVHNKQKSVQKKFQETRETIDLKRAELALKRAMNRINVAETK